MGRGNGNLVQAANGKPALVGCGPGCFAAKDLEGDPMMCEWKARGVNRRGARRGNFWQHPHTPPALAASLEQHRAGHNGQAM